MSTTNTPDPAREALARIRDKLIQAGAQLPVEVAGTIDSAMRTGRSHALLLVEQEIAALAAQPSAPKDSAGPVRIDGATVYVLNGRGANRWWAQVQPGQDDDGRRVSVDECRHVAQAIAAALVAPQDAVMLNGLTDAETSATASVAGLSAQDAVQAEPAVSMDDVHTLIGYAEGLKCDGQIDMPAYFYGLAERLAGMVGGAAAAERLRALAAAPATVRQSRMVEVPEGWTLVPLEPTPEMLKAARAADLEYQQRMGVGDPFMVGAYDHWIAMLAAAPSPQGDKT